MEVHQRERFFHDEVNLIARESQFVLLCGCIVDGMDRECIAFELLVDAYSVLSVVGALGELCKYLFLLPVVRPSQRFGSFRPFAWLCIYHVRIVLSLLIFATTASGLLIARAEARRDRKSVV